MNDIALVVLTPCRIDALCVGAFLAITLRSVGLERLAKTVRPWLFVLPLLVLLVSAWNATQRSLLHIVLPLRGTLVALSFGALLVTSLVTPRTSLLGRLFYSRSMRFIGKYSYGLYVFHGILAIALQEHKTLDRLSLWVGSHTAALLLQAVAGAALSLLVAVASYELFEKHFLRLKDRFAPSERKIPAPELVSPSPAG